MFSNVQSILLALGVLLILSCLLFGCAFSREGLESKVPLNTPTDYMNHCGLNTEESKCVADVDAKCQWNNGKCAPNYDSICGGYTDNNTCSDANFCKWDNETEKCASDYVNVCPSYQNQLACSESNQCMWNGDQCVKNPIESTLFTPLEI